MKTVEWKIGGMSCAHCQQTVEELIRASGASGKVDLAAGLVRIDYQENTDQLSKIQANIEANGYTVMS